jgi:hypothetical protein
MQTNIEEVMKALKAATANPLDGDAEQGMDDRPPASSTTTCSARRSRSIRGAR